MDSDSICGILLQTPTALLVVEQVSSTRAIYLHMFQLPKDWIALEYMHDHPCIPRECGGVGSTRVVSHCHFQHQGVFFCRGVTHPFPPMCQTAPARKITGSHPMPCIPLGCVGNTSLPNLHAYRDPSLAYNSQQ